MLLLDGSGSIDGADWTLQLQGYAAAISDPVNFPVDGSVAVSVVQWSYLSSSTRTRVEVPLTVLDSADAVAGVVARVHQISQIGSSTNPGDAVRTGTQELLDSGRSGAHWSLCMSTDGTSNAGESLSAATGFARANGVDKYTVVAIEDGSFGAAQAAAAYGPYVFGGGTVTVARTTTEFTTLISGCAADPVRVEALEVTQSVQDLDNTVPLVAGKTTVVRAYVSTDNGNTIRTSGRLRAFRQGAELAGSPLSPLNAAPVVVDGTWRADRDDLDRTLNFRLPSSWTSGSVDLTLELPGGVTCDGGTTGALPCSETVSFDSGFAADVQYRGFAWGAGASRTGVTSAELREQNKRTVSVLPVAGSTARYATIELDGRPGSVSDTNEILTTARKVANGPAEQRWYGVIPGSNGSEGGRAAGRVASSWLGGEGAALASGYGRNRAAHELGHTYGLHHTVNADQNGWTKVLWFINDLKKGWCGEVADGAASDYPYWTGSGAGARPALGPTGNVRQEMWGMDSRFVTSNPALALSDPDDVMPLMSYCSNPGTSGQVRWIDAPSYQQLLSTDREPISGGDDVAQADAADALLVRGVLSLDSAGATLKPALAVHATPTPDDPAGTHSLVIVDGSGAVLTQTRFTPDLQDGDSADGTEELTPADAIVNVVVAAGVEEASRIELRAADGTVVADAAFSAGAPTASIAAPTTGTPEQVHVTWDSSDPDGDALSHTLLSSGDGGISWQLVAADLTGNAVDLDRWSLPASDQAVLRVIASDGLRSTAATSPVFALPNLAPQVTILTPTDGTVLTGAQAFELTADAVDAEDGQLDGQQVRWTSDIDGELGTGATLLKRADELSEGTHTLTATVTDNDGAAVSASVRVVVQRMGDTPGEPIAACEVRYVIHGTWDTGSTVQVFVKNTGSTPWNGWQMTWALPQSETVANSWSTDLSVSGQTVTARNLPWNATVEPGAEVTFGLNGSFPSGTVAGVPAAFHATDGRCA